MSQKLTEINFGFKEFFDKNWKFLDRFGPFRVIVVNFHDDNEIEIKIFGGCKNGSFCPKLSKSFRHF